MAGLNAWRDRLSIDVHPEEHRQIKACAALRGETIREYVLESVRERLRSEKEGKSEDSAALKHKKDIDKK